MLSELASSYELRVRSIDPQLRGVRKAGDVNRYGDSAYYVSLNERESAPFENLSFQKAREPYVPEGKQEEKIQSSIDIFV
jgi:hypothetical protein